MRSRTCASVSSHSFQAYTTPGLSLELAIASANSSILARSLSSCGLVTIDAAVGVLRPRRSLWVDDMHWIFICSSGRGTPVTMNMQSRKATRPKRHRRGAGHLLCPTNDQMLCDPMDE